MWKRLLTGLLIAAFLISGCSGAKKVTEDKVQAVDPMKDAIIDPADPARKVAKLPILTMTPEYSNDRYEAALFIQKAMAQLGVELDPKPTDQKVVTDISRKEPWDWEAYFMQWGETPDRIDPQFFIFNLFHSTEIKDLGNNRQGYKNPEYDAVAALQQSSMDQDKRRDAVMKAQAMLAADVTVMPLWYVQVMQAYNKNRLTGVVNQGGIGIYNDMSFANMSVKTGDNIVRVAHRQDADLLNPITTAQFTDRQLLDLIYDTLVRLDADDKIRAAAAESWKIVDDTTIEFKLRAGQKFHDGHALTSDDVKFTYDFGKKNGLGKFDPYIKAIASVEAPDPLTVRFKLAKPDGSMMGSAFVSIPILPRHIWENQKDPLKWANPAPIGSGPFKFAYWRRGEELRLDAVKDHYTKPKIDAIIQVPFTNPEALLSAMELGKTDMVNPVLTPEQVTALKKVPSIEVTSTVGNGYAYFAFNLRRKPWSDPAFRQAMAYAIDVKTMTENIMKGYAIPAGPGRVISPSNKAWYNPNVTTYAFDLNKAKQILKDAGYKWDKDGKLYYPAPK